MYNTTALHIKQHYFLLYFVKFCFISTKLSLMPCNIPTSVLFWLCSWYRTRVILCMFPLRFVRFARMLSFWLKNNESKNFSADEVFALLILLAVSLEAINNIVTTAADLLTTLMYPITNASIWYFFNFSIVKNISLGSTLMLHDASVLHQGTTNYRSIQELDDAHNFRRWKGVICSTVITWSRFFVL